MLPADITERPDAEIVERLFGKDVKRELDRMAGKDDSESTTNVIKEYVVTPCVCVKYIIALRTRQNSCDLKSP